MTIIEKRKKLIEIQKAKIHNGIYVADMRSFGTREMLYIVEALLEDSVTEHMNVIEELVSRPVFFDHDCPFSIYICCNLIRKYNGILPQKVYEKFYEFVKKYKDFSFSKVWNFIGVNDNMPALHCGSMYMMGKIFKEQKFIDEVYRRMQYFFKMISRRKFTSEFNSPTYGIFVVYIFATLHNSAQEPHIKELALKIEQKLFKEIFSVYYKRGRKVAGPFSRAYVVDSTNNISNYDMLLSVVLPDSIAPSMDGFFEADYGSKGEVMGETASFFHVNYLSYTAEKFHPDPLDIEELLKRQYPVEVYGDAEVSSSRADNLDGIKNRIDPSFDYSGEINASKDFYEYPAGVSDIYTYISEEYCVGTCTKEFHNGDQTDSLQIFTGKDEISIYTRLAVDTGFHSYPNRDNSVNDKGRKLAFGKENTAIILYKPKTSAVRNFAPRLNFIIYDTHNKAKVDFYYEKNGKKVAFIETDELFLAICPVGNTFKNAELISNGRFKIIAFEYAEVSDFSTREALLTSMGAVVEISKKDISAAGFKNKYEKFDVTDYLFANMHTRYTSMRVFGYQNDKYRFDCEYSMVSEGIKYLNVEKI